VAVATPPAGFAEFQSEYRKVSHSECTPESKYSKMVEAIDKSLGEIPGLISQLI
jgi:hypothetical protein